MIGPWMTGCTGLDIRVVPFPNLISTKRGSKLRPGPSWNRIVPQLGVFYDLEDQHRSAWSKRSPRQVRLGLLQLHGIGTAENGGI